jgi:UrcA family protein
MNKVTSFILISALAIGTQHAHADVSDNSPRQVLIHFADVDLTRIDGVSVLYRRLHSAAKDVCAPLYGKDAERASVFKHCVTDAMSRAVAQVAEPNLSAYYRAKLEGRSAMALETIARQ